MSPTSADRSRDQAMDRPTPDPTPRTAAVFDSVTSVALRSALDALALRQRVIADNVANIATPGFLAGRVGFEDALADAVRAGDGRLTLRVSRSLEPTRANGNNVNLDAETLLNVDTNLRYQLATRAVDGSFTALRTAMRTS
jgi:flagellar basal-body rod protein FlgB